MSSIINSLKTWLGLILLCLPLSALGANEGQFLVGVLGGNVTLTGDVGDAGGNGLGYGAGLGYAVRDDIIAQFQYIQSDHDRVQHQEISAGADIRVSGFDAAVTFVSAGVVLASNEVDFDLQNLTTETVSSDAFGIYFGGGLDFELSKNFEVGLQARYNYVFETEEEVSGMQSKIVESNFSVLARLQIYFGESKLW